MDGFNSLGNILHWASTTGLPFSFNCFTCSGVTSSAGAVVGDRPWAPVGRADVLPACSSRTFCCNCCICCTCCFNASTPPEFGKDISSPWISSCEMDVTANAIRRYGMDLEQSDWVMPGLPEARGRGRRQRRRRNAVCHPAAAPPGSR